MRAAVYTLVGALAVAGAAAAGGGWQTAQDSDALSFEWQYFAFCAEGVHAIAGYVASNLGDEDLLPALPQIGAALGVPSGGSAALVLWSGNATERPLAAYRALGPAAVSGEVLDVELGGDGGDRAALTADPQGLRLGGSVAGVQFDLAVTYEESSHAPASGSWTGVGPWTVNVKAPSGSVAGEVGGRDVQRGSLYYENSWGRALLPAGGWDFGFFLGACDGSSARPSLVWQSYYVGLPPVVRMDAELSFVDVQAGALSVRFTVAANELGWRHDEWAWDEDARLCAPRETRLVGHALGDDGEAYILNVTTRVVAHAPLLSDENLATQSYVIEEHFLEFAGGVNRARDGASVAVFDGWGGGEFSGLRQPAHARLACSPDGGARSAAFAVPFPPTA